MSNLNAGTAWRFLLVGGAATGLQYLLLAMFVWLGVFDGVTASAVGFAIAAVANYLLNARFTFATSNRHSHGLPRFAATAAAGCLINTLVLDTLVGFGVAFFLAQLIATGVVFVWNYMINAIWTFRPQQ
ncbi:GtrA family protein [Uliginosibacterium sp. sgz301328]|uniref:GtrA family protein n=1 Tax=Uliginosibacterium sp. sgz301328 TaxID=3243764 RepID=UPI00359E6323